MSILKFFLIFLFLTSLIVIPRQADDNLKFNATFSLPDYIPVPSGLGLTLKGSSFFIDIKNLGDTANFRVLYLMHPDISNISVSFSDSKFSLNSGEKKRVYVSISVKKGTFGLYNLSIIVEGKIDNVALASSKKIIIECIRGEVYFVRVITSLLDGTLIYSRILVDIERYGSRFTIIETYGPLAKIYLIRGRYYFSAYIGEKKVSEKLVEVNSNNTTVKLTFSLIEITSIEITRHPKFTTDPILFTVTIESLSDLIGSKKIDVYAILQFKDQNESYFIGTVILKGKQKISLTGYIDPQPEWNNQTYVINIVVKSSNVTMASLETTIQVKVYSRKIIVYRASIPIIFYIMPVISGVLGVLLGSKLRITKRKEEIKSYPVEIKKVIIGGEGRILLIYDPINESFREDLLTNDRYIMSLSMVEALITMISEREGALRSYSTEKSKYIIGIIEGGFRVILEVPTKVDENDPQLADKLKKIVRYIEFKHREVGIKSPSSIINLDSYKDLLSDIVFII